MSLEEDIINNEISGKEKNVFDAEVVFQKPKTKRKLLPIILVGCFILVLGMGGLFFDELKSMYLSNFSTAIKKDKPVIHAATPPDDIVAVAPVDPNAPATKSITHAINANTSDTAKLASQQTQPVLPATQPNSVQAPKTEIVTPDLTAAAVKPNSNTETKPTEPVIKITSPAAPSQSTNLNQSANNERFDVLEQKVKDLTAALDELSKKIDTLASAKKAEATKPQYVAKVAVNEKLKLSNKPEVVKSMKELHILALLSDGVMFDGDIAVSLGQYAKHLNGKILNINTEQNTITTDSKIFKVQ